MDGWFETVEQLYPSQHDPAGTVWLRKFIVT